MARFAYVRVSTKEQSIDRQMEAIKPLDIPKNNIFCDYQSGKNFDRPGYKSLMKRLKAGDLLIIKSIDRLGRNYNEILLQWQYITKEVGADIQVLDMELLNTRVEQGNLTGTLIADLVLQIFAYVAQTEREFIHQRQAEGIAAAKARGKKFGRTPKTVPQDLFESLYEEWKSGKISLRNAAEKLDISHSTFYRRCKKYEKSYEKIVALSRLKDTP